MCFLRSPISAYRYFKIIGPDGNLVKEQNVSTGELRNTFELQMQLPGTYRLSLGSDTINASYKIKGEMKRWRGAAENMAKEIPADAEEIKTMQVQSRIETFVTSGSPNTKALELVGKGLELQAITHPNDLMAGETATFRLMLDGKPAPKVQVTVIHSGVRYRQKLDEQTLTTDADGKLKIVWPAAGMYWLEAITKDEGSKVAGVKDRRASYVTTLEVLPQ